MHDLTLAVQSMRRHPVLSALMVLAIAAGIAASMITITVYHGRAGHPIWWKADKLYAVMLDTRDPASDMHADLAEVRGKKPVALLFATPQLCTSRVCGPVADIALQLKSKYGRRMEFIHQEVWVDNDTNKGLRPPLEAFKLETEPWLFVLDKSGKVTTRLEGSFGLREFEDAIKTGL